MAPLAPLRAQSGRIDDDAELEVDCDSSYVRRLAVGREYATGHTHGDDDEGHPFWGLAKPDLDT